ncbi:hypothetical protein V1527DRAFT_457684 [Lipomyces starkeyi]
MMRGTINSSRFLSCFCRNLVGFPLLDWWGFIVSLLRFLIVVLFHVLLVCFFFFFISIFGLIFYSTVSSISQDNLFMERTLAIGFDSLILLFLFLTNFFLFLFLFLFFLLFFFILRRSRVSILVLFFLLFLIGRESLKLLFRITASSRHFY